MSGLERSPKVFISYSWDNEPHKEWVREFAARLRGDGVNVTLDQWHVRPGDQLAAFMEQAVRENDFVLIICTPTYKIKSENRTGGVGYEGDVIQGEVLLRSNHRKFIPVLRSGEWLDSSPSQLIGKRYIVLKDGTDYERNYEMLLRNLHSQTETPPPIARKPDFSSDSVPTTVQCDLKGHADSVVRVATTIDQNRIVSIDRGGQIIVWDIRTGVCVRMVSTSYNYHGVLAVALNGRHAIALERLCGRPQNLAIFDLEADSPPLVLEDTELESKQGYGNDLTAVAATPDWRIAVSGSKRGQLAVWDIKAGVKSRTIQAFEATSQFGVGGTTWEGGVESIALSQDGNFAITSAQGYDGRIRIWDIARGVLLREFPAHKARYWEPDDASTRLGLTQICLTPDGTKLLTGDVHGRLRVWEVETGSLLIEAQQTRDWIHCLAISPDGRIALSSGVEHGAEKGRIAIWDFESGRELDHRWYHSGCVHSLAVSRDSRFVISGGDDKTVKVRTLIE